MADLTSSDMATGALGSSLTPNTRVLIRKNLTLKQRQYATVCKCLCLPCPFALAMEFFVPVLIIGFVSYLKTLTDVDVVPVGWGGDVPTGSLDTECKAGVQYQWDPLLTAFFTGANAQLRTSDCTGFENLMTQPEPFFSHLANIHWYENARIGLAADDPADLPKVQAFRRWISENWYPRHHMEDVPGCHTNHLLT